MWTTSVDGERAGKGERVPDQQTPPAGPSDDLDDAWRFVWSEADAPSRAWLRNTRAYAKRQITWFKKDPRLVWFSPEQTQEAINTTRQFLTTDVGG